MCCEDPAQAINCSTGVSVIGSLSHARNCVRSGLKGFPDNGTLLLSGKRCSHTMKAAGVSAALAHTGTTAGAAYGPKVAPPSILFISIKVP